MLRLPTFLSRDPAPRSRAAIAPTAKHFTGDDDPLIYAKWDYIC